MRKSQCVVVCAIALVAICVTPIAAVHAAINRVLSVGINERLRPDNSVYYVFGVGDYPFPRLNLDGRIEQFISPGGLVFDRNNDSFDPFGSLEFDTFSELTQSIVGQWQFNTADESTPLDIETYSFEVQNFGLSDITAQRPQIFEPANGSFVDFPIEVRWDPTITSYSYLGRGLTGSVTKTGPGVLALDLEIGPGAINPYFTFAISGTSQFLPQFVSPLSAPTDPTYNLSTRMFFTRTNNITVYPRQVPEPQSLATVTACLIPLVLMCRDPRVSA